MRLMLCFLPAWAMAQAGTACVENGTVAQTNACAVKAFQEADTGNQILYGDVMRALSADERPALRRNQNEWTRQRAQHCKRAEAALEDRSDWSARYHDCLTRQIKARDQELRRWLHLGPPLQ